MEPGSTAGYPLVCPPPPLAPLACILRTERRGSQPWNHSIKKFKLSLGRTNGTYQADDDNEEISKIHPVSASELSQDKLNHFSMAWL